MGMKCLGNPLIFHHKSFLPYIMWADMLKDTLWYFGDIQDMQTTHYDVKENIDNLK